MEYAGGKRFSLAFMRYTGEWIEVFENLSLEKCLEIVKDEGFFQP